MVASAHTSRRPRRGDAQRDDGTKVSWRRCRSSNLASCALFYVHCFLRALPPSLVLAVGVFISVVAGFAFAKAALQDAEKRFERSTRFTENWVRDRTRAYETSLAQTGAFLSVSQGTSRSDFHSYVHDGGLLNAFPGVRAIGYVDRVSAATSSSWLAEARSFVSEAPLKPSPSVSRPVVFPVTYFESRTKLDPLTIGKDHGTEPVRAAALELARDQGRVHLTGRTHSFTTEIASSEYVALMYAPVYERGEPRSTVQERRAALTGYAYMLFGTNDLFEGLDEEVQSQTTVTGQGDSEYEVFDGEETSEDALLFRDPGDTP